MSDEIWKERFTQAGRADAWHKKGTHFDSSDQSITLADVVREAGADFEIAVKPLTIELDVPNPDWIGHSIPGWNQLDDSAKQILLANSSEPEFKHISLPTKQNAIVRLPHLWKGAMDGAVVLGTGSDRYVPVQNTEIAQIFEKVAVQYRPETCGVLQQGEIFFLTLNAGMFDVRVNGHDQEHNAYIYLFDRKTPGSMMQIGAGATRVVCWNTLHAAERSARIMIPLQHSDGIEKMIAAVAKALEGLQSSQQALRDAMDMMARREMSHEEAQNTFRLAWPDPQLSNTILSLDTLTNPIDSPNNSQIDQVAVALSKVAETQIIQDRINEAKKQYASKLEFVEYLRETANASLLHMSDTERLGINGYTVLNAVSETLEHRSERIRGDVATDMLIGERSRVMDRVSSHLLSLSQN